ncbi:hypothetical protein [Calidifontibacter indicus]|uniref:Lipoprotein n=1 Tax=Calidifontibacter indicus TaxID=419650 RepID=A0A3D9UPC4_9MICO|nr:hypothetical protein [Calidifontibacter indicus]REF31179.1 hypothetical protein DFJ65_2224 [Calidifontibacter indicus]
MTPPAANRFVRLALASSVLLAVTGCGATGDGPSCTGFALSLISDQGGGAATPVAAAQAYAAKNGLPKDGWATAETSDSGVLLKADDSRLHVLKLRDGTWTVDSGQRC